MQIGGMERRKIFRLTPAPWKNLKISKKNLNFFREEHVFLGFLISSLFKNCIHL